MPACPLQTRRRPGLRELFATFRPVEIERLVTL
jgi:hypothetical protein